PLLLPALSADYSLSPYDELQPAVDYFGASFGRNSIATAKGMNTASVFDPFWASGQEACQSGEAPLDCELRDFSPSVAIVMFGQNDLRVMNRDDYHDNLTKVIQRCLNAGVIPIISTFSSTTDDTDYYGQTLYFNAIAIQISQELDVPLMNYWLASRS